MAAELVIRTTKAEYVGGDTLYGAVYLKVSGPTAAFGIWIRFYGFEKFSFDCVVPKLCSLVRGKDDNCIGNIEHHVDTGRVTLYEFDGSIALGQYVFPFSMRLPDDLPASTEVKWSNGKAEICYHVEAVLMGVETVMASERVCIMQPSLARSMMQDCDSELAVAGRDVLPECRVFRLRTEFPFVMSHMTITASLDKQEYHTGELMKLQLRLGPCSGIKPKVSHLQLQLLRETRVSIEKLPSVYSSLIGCVKRNWSASFGTLVSRISSVTSSDNCVFPEQCEDGSALVVWDSGRVQDKDGTLLIKGFDDLLIPLKDGNSLCIPATAFGHSVTVLYTLKIEFTFKKNNPVVLNIPVYCVWQRNSEWQKWKPAAWTSDCEMMSMSPHCHITDELVLSELSSLPGLHVS